VTFFHEFTVPNVPPHIGIIGPKSVDATKPIILEVKPMQDVDGGNFEIVWDIVQSPTTSEQQPQNAYARGPHLRLPEDGVTTEKDIGTWIFRATATDNEGDSDVKEVTVNVNNLPPKLSLTGGEDIDFGEIILIDATGSQDPDGGDLTFQWDILQAPVDAPLGAGDGFSTSYIDIQTDESYAGTWIFQLIVTDNEDESVESEEFAVLVDAPPRAVITGPTEPISSFSELVLDGSDSVDPDSPCPDRPDLNYCHETIVGRPAEVSQGIVDYCWWLIDVPPELWEDYPTGRVDEVFEVAADSSTLTLEPGTLETGDWTFELEVRDDEGNEDRTTFAVSVVKSNSSPTAVLNAPTRYTMDISDILSQDITLSGFQSYDLDNVLDEEELKPGVGIIDYQWSIVEAPTGCTPPALPSGKTAHTVNLYTAGENVEPACQGFWRIRLTVTDDDSPAMTGSAETNVIIGNCPQPLCIDYPTTLNPQFMDFTGDTDIFIYYHLDSALYDNATFSFSMFSMLEIFHESDLTTPVYTSIDQNVLASDKGGYLVFHWDGYNADTHARPQTGLYTVQITLLDDMLDVTAFVATEPNAIRIAFSEYQIQVTGFLGDVIKVDMSETGLNNFNFEASQVSNNPDFPANHNFPANQLGYVAKIDNWETNLRNSGVFYFVPTAAGTSELRLTAEDSQSGVSTCISCVIEVQDGYSTAGPNRVSFDSNRLSNYSQQQRLRYFGFPGRYGNSLKVDGSIGPETKWAIGLFNHAVNDRNFNNNKFPNSHFDHLGRRFINAINAPRWVELTAGTGFVINPAVGGGPQPERWATSWAREVLEEAGTNWNAVNPAIAMGMQGASLEQGGNTPYHGEHEAGMDIDIDIPSTNHPQSPFYRTHTIAGGRYIAARTRADPNGEGHIIVHNPRTGIYVAYPFRPNLPVPQGAVRHNARNYENRALLGDIAHLIADNRAVGYNLSVVRGQIQAFTGITATSSGAQVRRIYCNDPRTWDIHNVTFSRGHGGHFHVDVERPAIQRRFK